MKFRYLLAALFLCLAVSCQQGKIGTLSEIQVSESYLSIDVNGGSAVLDVTTTGAWEIDPASVPAWLSVSPMSGSAGKNQITFKAEQTKSTNTAEVKLKCAGQTQYINIIQFAQKGELKVMTVAEAIALINTVDKHDGQSYNLDGEYCVKGIVSKIDEISPSYGNATYYLSDDGKHEAGKWLEVYRGAWLNGAAFKSGDEFAVGDELTIIGELMSYKGTPETKEKTAYVIAVEKSLISIESVDPEDATIPAEGGSVAVTLKNKGNGIYVELPEDADWLSIGAIAGNTVTFKAAANEGGDRETTVVIKTTDGKKDYATQQTISQAGSILEVTAAEFNAQPDGKAQFRVTGIVTDIVMDKDDDSKYNKYGNFYLNDDTGRMYVYGLLPEAGGKSGQDVLTQKGIKYGDLLTVVGPKGSYKDAPQMVNAYYVEHTPVQALSCAAFNEQEDGDALYLISGYVDEIVNTKYGNFYIKDGSGISYVYGLVPTLSGASGQELLTKLDVQVGDYITLVGPKTSYKGDPQMKNAIFVEKTRYE